MHKRLLAYLLILSALLSLGAAPQPQRSVTYERYDVEIDVRPDGSLSVAETYQLRFEGEFHTGFAEIPLDYVTDIVDVQVREGERAYEESGSGAGTATKLSWKAGTSTMKVLGDILEESSSGGGGGGFGGGGFRSGSWGSGGSSFGGGSSGGSGGGGSLGFG